MCGRFALSTLPAQFQLAFGCAAPEGLTPRWNITPDTRIALIRAGEGGAQEAAFAR
jgi:putative SOS response-associated peptidase YedK